jgi:hypothetical protein
MNKQRITREFNQCVENALDMGLRWQYQIIGFTNNVIENNLNCRLCATKLRLSFVLTSDGNYGPSIWLVMNQTFRPFARGHCKIKIQFGDGHTILQKRYVASLLK